MVMWFNFIASLILPLWGIAILCLGLRWLVIGWLGCGVAVLLVGLILTAGNPWVGTLLSKA